MRFPVVVVLLLCCVRGSSVGHAQGGAQLASDSEPAATEEVGDSLQMKNEFLPEWYDMFANIPNDWVRYGQVTLTTEKVPALLAMTAVTAALIYSDHETYRMSRELYESSGFAKSASDVFEYIGDGRPQFGLAAAFAAYGFAAKDKRALRVASQTTEVILSCGFIVQVIKHITGRESPIVATSPRGEWRFFPNQIEYHKHVPHYDAFPSGHIATTLATVTVVAENYPEVHWIRPVGYTLVALVGVAMANTGIHWYSDYPLGLALGYSFGMIVSHPEGVEVTSIDKENRARLSLGPVMTRTGAGIGLSLSF